MFNNKQDIENIATEIVSRLRKSFYEKDMVVTGATVNSLHYKLDYTNGVLEIVGASTIRFNEGGRAPLKSTQSDSEFLKRLEVWRQIRGIDTPAKTIKYFINKQGTRLWQGKDKRFAGKESKVISDVINPELAKEVTKTLGGLALKQVATLLRNSTIEVTKL